MRNTITLVAGLLIVFGVFITTNVQSQNRPNRPRALSQEMKRFDLNNDGQLSADERAISIEVIVLETFSDTQLSEREIRQMYSARSPMGLIEEVGDLVEGAALEDSAADRADA